MPMKMIPYGISNYDTIIREEYAYIDKTMYVSLLEQAGHYNLFVRPQRFGKSLFASMLGYYYDIAEKDNFDLLFSNTDIGQNPTKNKNRYHILQLDFSGIEMDSYEIMQESFTKKMHSMLLQFCARYNLDITFEMDSPGAQLSHLFTQFQIFRQTGQINSDAKIYIIIDEYDYFFTNWLRNPLIVNWHNDSKELGNTIFEAQFLRIWYEVLKEGTKTVVDRIFITGIFPLTMESGFDFLQNLSMDSEFNEMMGFTRAEVEQLIRETISEELPADFMDTLIEDYGGYCFSKEWNEHVLHSALVLYYLQHYQRKHKPPRDMLDQHAFNYFRELEDVITFKRSKEKREILKDIFFGSHTFIGFNASFYIGQKFEGSTFDLLLFHLGIFRIKATDNERIELKLGNAAMSQIYLFYSLIFETGCSFLLAQEISQNMR